MKDEKYVNFPNIKKNVVEKRVYQELLTAKAIENNTLVVAPTGLGKTIVAVLLIAHFYSPKKSILFLAPTKPLVIQHRKSLLNVLDIPQDKIILITGQTPPLERKKIYSQKGMILCATPQTISNDLKKSFFSKDDFNVLIFDEAHRAIGDYAYVPISSFFDNPIKRLGLTASPGHNKQKIKLISENLKLTHIEIKTKTDFDVVDYVQDVNIETVFIELDDFSKKISEHLNLFISKKVSILRRINILIPKNFTKKQILLIQQQVFKSLSTSKSSISFMAIINLSLVIKAMYALELIQTQGFYSLKIYLEKMFRLSKTKNTTKTISQFVNSKEILESYKLLINLDLEKNLYSKEKEIISYVNNFLKQNKSSKVLIFNNYRDSARNLVNFLNKEEDVVAVRFIGQASKDKDKGLSQKEQIKILSDFKAGLFNVLVCTSVGEEGLDIPSVDLVVFYDAVPSEIRSIQRRGRTGRFNAGKVVIFLNKGTIDEHYYYVSLKKEKTMHKNLKNFFK